MAKRDKESCPNVPHGCQSAFDRRQKILTMTPSDSALYARDQASRLPELKKILQQK